MKEIEGSSIAGGRRSVALDETLRAKATGRPHQDVAKRVHALKFSERDHVARDLVAKLSVFAAQQATMSELR